MDSILALNPALSAHRAIVKAIVCLNFNEPDKALDVLLEALSESNFKGIANGNAAA